MTSSGPPPPTPAAPPTCSAGWRRARVGPTCSAPACPADLFEAFAAGDAPAAAANPALTVEAMARLAAHPNTRTRQLLDENPALPVELRLRLAADPDHDTRIAAGQQATHLPDEVVAGLADMSREVI